MCEICKQNHVKRDFEQILHQEDKYGNSFPGTASPLVYKGGRASYQNNNGGKDKEVIAGIGLGIAVFTLGKDLLTSGSFSVSATVGNYVHQNTPPGLPLKTAQLDFRIFAWNPRPITGGWESFWFKLTYGYNGNDIFEAKIEGLVSKSSSMYMSTFSIRFEPSPHSVPLDPVAEIKFDITGNWNPVGRGNVSLINSRMTVKADGSFPTIFVDSEESYVKADQFYPIVPPVYTAPYIPAVPVPIPTTTLRRGSKGELVKQLQRNLAKWALQTKQSFTVTEDGSFGPLTESAVRKFQQWHNLKVDGIVGPITWKALGKYN